MNAKDITEAKDPDLRASPAALQRAAKMARQTAIQTDTDLVIMKDGHLVRVSAKTLRATAESPTKKTA